MNNYISIHIIIYKLLLFLLILINLSNSNATLKLYDFMLCGGLSTAITDLLLYPIDTVKVAQQSSRSPLTLLQALSKIKKDSGLFGLYSGAYGYAMVDGMGAAIFFSVYENVKKTFNKHISSPLTPYLSASAAFVVSSSFMVPAELIKVKMQSNAFKTLPECLSGLWRFNNLGLRGFYQGYIATLVRDLPYFGLQLGCYDNIRESLEKMKLKYDNPNNKYRMIFDTNKLDLIASLISGAITGLLTNPMDVVTARLMTQQDNLLTSTVPALTSTKLIVNNILSSSTVQTISNRLTTSMVSESPNIASNINGIISSNSIHHVPYTGMTNCIVRIAREEGLSAFFSGAVARVAWIAPFTAVSLCLNEELKRQRINYKKSLVINKI